MDRACAEFFFNNQKRLFDRNVAENVDEAMDFLEACMAEVFDSKDELLDYMEAEGVDISEYEDLTEALEVFALPDGRYLYVEA